MVCAGNLELFTTGTCSLPLLFSSTSHPYSPVGSSCFRLLEGHFSFTPCRGQPRMAEAKGPAARTMWSGEISLEQQCGISWEIFHCRSNAPAAVVQQWTEVSALCWVGSSRSLIISNSHHRDNKAVWWDRDVTIWARALLRLPLCFYSSLPRSLGYTRLGVRSIWQCCSFQCCLSLPSADKRPTRTSLQLQPVTSLSLNAPESPSPSFCLCAGRKSSADISFQKLVQSNWLSCF